MIINTYKLKPYLYATTVIAAFATAGAFTTTAKAADVSQVTTTSTTSQVAQAQTTATNDLSATSVASSASSKASESSAAEIRSVSYASAAADVNTHTIDTMNSYVANHPEVVDSTWDQNFHFNNSDGYSNDIQSILPHYKNDGKIDYWDIYYLAQPLARVQGVQYIWKHMTTTDFKTFKDFDTSNRFSVNNIAIPDKYYVDSNYQPFQIADNNRNDIPWGAAASGSIINNDGHFKLDEYGNKIDANAKLAYFTNFTNGQRIYLAYSNNDGQFHPYGPDAVMDPAKINGLQNKGDFRDPYVTRLKNGSYVAYVAGGLDDLMYVLTSKDGVKWDYHPENTINLSGYRVAEMPVIKTVNGQPMMFFIAGSKDYTGTQSGNYVITGSFNTDGIFMRTSDSKITKLDDGFDNFAGNYTNLNANKLISMSWIGNWTYGPNLVDYGNIKHFGTYTLARTIGYQNGKFLVDPVEPNTEKIGAYNLKANAPFSVGTNNKVSLNFNGNQKIKLTRQDFTNNNVELKINGSNITLTRKWAMNATMNKSTTVNVGAKVSQAILYVDNSSIEIYLPEVHKMYTLMTLSYKQNSGYKMTLSNSATAEYYAFNVNSHLSADAAKSELTAAKTQAQQRAKEHQQTITNQWSEDDYKKNLTTVKKEYTQLVKDIKAASSNQKLAEREAKFNRWLQKLSDQITKRSKITIDKSTKYYSKVNGQRYERTKRQLKNVKVLKVINQARQTWYQVKINAKLVYIAK